MSWLIELRRDAFECQKIITTTLFKSPCRPQSCIQRNYLPRAGACKDVARMLKEKEESDSDGTSKKSALRVLEVMAEDCGDLAANFAIPPMPAVLVFADGEVRIFFLYCDCWYGWKFNHEPI